MDKKLINQKLDLVMDKLMNLDTPDIKMDKAAAPEEMKKGLYARDFGIREWDWPQGVGLYGLLQLQAARGTREYDAPDARPPAASLKPRGWRRRTGG